MLNKQGRSDNFTAELRNNSHDQEEWVRNGDSEENVSSHREFAQSAGNSRFLIAIKLITSVTRDDRSANYAK